MARRKRNPLFVQGRQATFKKGQSLQTAIDKGVETYTTDQKQSIDAATTRFEQGLGATLIFGIESSLDEYKQELRRRIEEQRVVIARRKAERTEVRKRLAAEKNKTGSSPKIVRALKAGFDKLTADIRNREAQIQRWEESYGADVEQQKRRLELEQGFSEEAQAERARRVAAYREDYTRERQKEEEKRIRDSVSYTSNVGITLDSQGIFAAIIQATRGVKKNYINDQKTYEEYSDAAYDTAIDTFWRALSNDRIQKAANATTSNAIAKGITDYFFVTYTSAIKSAQAGALRKEAVQLDEDVMGQTGFISALRQLNLVMKAYDWLRSLFGGRLPSNAMIQRSNAILASQGKPLIPSVPNMILDALIGKPIRNYKIQSAIIEEPRKQRITYLAPTGDLSQYSGTIINKVGMDTGMQLPRKSAFQKWKAAKARNATTQEFIPYLKPTIVAIRIFELNSYSRLAVDQTSQSDLLSGLERVSDDQLQAGPADVMSQLDPGAFPTITPFEARDAYRTIENALFVAAQVVANTTVKSVRAFLEVPEVNQREGIYVDSKYTQDLESELRRLDQEDRRPFGYDTLRDQSFSKLLEKDEREAAEREAYAAAEAYQEGEAEEGDFDDDDYYDDDDDFKLNNNPLVTNQSLLLQQNTAYIMLNLVATLFMNRNIHGVITYIENEMADNVTEIKSGITGQAPLSLYQGLGALNPQGNSSYAIAKLAICKKLLMFFQYHMYEILFKDIESDIIRRYRQLNSKDGKFDRRYAQQYAEAYVQHRKEKVINYIKSYDAWFNQYDNRSMMAMTYNALGYTFWIINKSGQIELIGKPFLFPNKEPIPYDNPVVGQKTANQDGSGTPFFNFITQHRTDTFGDLFIADRAVLPINTPLGIMQKQIRELLGPFIGLPPGVNVNAYGDQYQYTVVRVLYYCTYGIKRYFIPKMKEALRK